MRVSAESKQLFLEETFGKQENTIKFCGLTDCSSDGDFDEKLKTLKPVWDARELAVSQKSIFHEWFITEKVDSFSLFFYFVIFCRKQKMKRFFKLREHDTRVLNLGRTYFAVSRRLKPLVLKNRGP